MIMCFITNTFGLCPISGTAPQNPWKFLRRESDNGACCYVDEDQGGDLEQPPKHGAWLAASRAQHVIRGWALSGPLTPRPTSGEGGEVEVASIANG